MKPLWHHFLYKLELLLIRKTLIRFHCPLMNLRSLVETFHLHCLESHQPLLCYYRQWLILSRNNACHAHEGLVPFIIRILWIVCTSNIATLGCVFMSKIVSSISYTHFDCSSWIPELAPEIPIF